MKKVLFACIALAVMAAFMFGACGENTAPDDVSSDEPKTQVPDPDSGQGTDPGTDPEDASDFDGDAYICIVVSGYEWGPSVDKLVLDFYDPISGDVSQDIFSSVYATEQRTVTDVYFCDEDGNELADATESEYLAVELATDTYRTDEGLFTDCEGNPFAGSTMSMNAWADSFEVSLTFADDVDLMVGTHPVAGGTEMSSDAIWDVICPDTAVFEKDSYKYEGPVASIGSESTYIRLNRALYTPAQALEDNEKNPLIIWLHGGGEGYYASDDIDIALLGAEVTALAKSPIQDYFNGGAYVLAVQCNSRWMDPDGNFNYNNSVNEYGGQQSYYTEALMAAIEDCVDSHDDIDPDRIIVGGCSNGGYMTMNLMFEYGEYFAAYYPICEGYLDANITDEMIQSVKDFNIWFVQSENDMVLAPASYAIPTFYRLIQAGAQNVHYTLTDHVYGTDSPDTEYIGHYSWVYVFNDADKLHYEFDNSAVLAAEDNSYVTYENCSVEANFWEWIASQSLPAA